MMGEPGSTPGGQGCSPDERDGGKTKMASLPGINIWNPSTNSGSMSLTFTRAPVLESCGSAAVAVQLTMTVSSGPGRTPLDPNWMA
jgi:hypothetical protein